MRVTNENPENAFYVFADNLADKFMLRGGVYFMNSFPRTISGKVPRRKIKDIVFQNELKV